MTPRPASAHATRCHADPGCRRAVCFRIWLHASADEILGPPADACADHLGGFVQELARAARDDGFSEGYLQVCAIAPGARPSPAEGTGACLPFASIALVS